jgi:hypothetical protein
LGGDDSFVNLRLLCRGPNRGRPVEPLKKWSEPNYWDEKIAEGRLREIQCLAGCKPIDELIDGIVTFESRMEAGPFGDRPANFRRALLNKVTMIPGATGIGKALLAQSVLFKLNQIISVGRPRVKSVLWLTIDTTLRDLGRIEIEEEGYKYGIVSKKPIVGVAQGFSDLIRGPMGNDITISAIQSLWVVEQDDGTKRRSPEEQRAALSQYDTIIFDECDWGNEQVQFLSALATHALQFSLTASPPIFNKQPIDLERVLKRFVLISDDAVADYNRAKDLDGCLKELQPNINRAAGHTGSDQLSAGFRKNVPGKVGRDHIVFRSAIIEAVIDADNLETNMKKRFPEHYYSPHVMVRMDEVADVKAMRPDLQACLDDLYKNRKLKNVGWNVSMIFTGHERHVDPDERNLSGKTRRGLWRHPFMAAKNDGGKATDRSKRILLMCNIGVRGINNWPIQTIVDCTANISHPDLIQFNWGRPIRLPDHLAQHLRDKEAMRFVTATVYIPDTAPPEKMLEKQAGLEASRNFIVNMQEYIANVGFVTWCDILNGEAAAGNPGTIDPGSPPITRPDKYKIQEALAIKLANTGTVGVEDVVQVVENLFPTRSPKQREKLKNYAAKLFDPKIKDIEMSAIAITKKFETDPASVVVKLEPQDSYDVDILKRFVKNDPDYRDVWNQYCEELDKDSFVAKDALSKALRAIQIANYREPSRIRSLHEVGDGVFNELSGEVISDLRTAGQLPHDIRNIFKAIIGSATKLFGVAHAGKGGPMDHPAYHIAILGRYRRTIQSMARGRLICDGDLGEHLKRFAQL